MTRTILFRAKSPLFGEMLKGYYYFNSKFHCLKTKVYNEKMDIEIDIKTLGQFTGLYDKNKKMIYEGDIVGDIKNPRSLAVIKYDESKACYVFHQPHYDGLICTSPQRHELNVVGNIYENPELLEVKND